MNFRTKSKFYCWVLVLSITIGILHISENALGKIYYVNPRGNDNNSGDSYSPLATIQKGINKAKGGDPNSYDIVRIAKGTYETAPIFLNHNNQGLFFEEGVEVVAKSNKGFPLAKGPFGKPNACLFKATDKENISIRAYGAIFRMRRAEYKKLKGEWRTVITLRRCKNIEITGAALKDSGGDGIYITRCKDILIKDVTCDNNLRNAISVISVDGLVIENCILKNSKGKKPGAGIDFEPNKFTHRLNKIVIKNTVISGNDGYAIVIQPVMLRSKDKDAEKKYIDILFEDVTVRDGKGVYVAYFSDYGPDGVIKFKSLLVENTTFGTWIGKSSKCVDLIFEDCTWRNIKKDNPPLSIFSNGENTAKPGGIKFTRCKIFDSFDRPVIIFSKYDGDNLYDIQGDFYVENENYNGPFVDWKKANLVNVDLVIKSNLLENSEGKKYE